MATREVLRPKPQFTRKNPSTGRPDSQPARPKKRHKTDWRKGRRARYAAQRAARRLKAGEAIAQGADKLPPVCLCGAKRIIQDEPIGVMHDAAAGRAWLSNLWRCGSIWQCPVCASRITEQRRRELVEAIDGSHYDVLLVTFTLSHAITDSLADLMQAITEAYRRLHSGRWWQAFQDYWCIKGSIRSTEVTRSDASGWHPHFHVLVFTGCKWSDDAVVELESILAREWQDRLAKCDRFADLEHGVTVRRRDKAAEYVTKYGVIDELVKAGNKAGRGDSRTPLQLLQDYDSGDSQAGVLWLEYTHAMHGRAQLVWSRGLRDKLGLSHSQPATIEESMAETDNGVLVAELTAEQHQAIISQRLECELLELVEAGKVAGLRAFLRQHNIPDVGLYLYPP